MPRDDTAHKFGTFGGVFTPCTLTILGVIMFLRFGQVVGQAGIWHAALVVLLAKAITTMTALSLSAIATNTRVKGGGAYFLISRSLGIEFGGAIGIVFFLSQAVSVAMYVIGFTEALLATFPNLGVGPRGVATLVNVGVFACVLVGAGWTVKVQFGILAVLVAAIVSFAVGAVGQVSFAQVEANWAPQYAVNESFVTMFALFFPAATGIMAGANMSGDLRNPGRSIPSGTLAAILVTGIVYLGMAVLLGMSTPRAELLGNPMVVGERSWSPTLIVAGIFAATLSSALGSMMGAPRILQAMAKDRVFRSLTMFARGSGKSNEPRRATVLSFVIAEAGILLGDLDAIAPMITMFFMITYGALNAATFVEAISNNPSYRPAFRFSHWSTSLLGALGCTVAMFLIDPVWATVAVAGMAIIHRFLAFKDLQATWGDVHGGSMLERARRSLVALEQERYHPKNWRPAVLALGVGKEDRIHLAVFSRWMAGPHGLLILGHVLLAEPEAYLERHVTQRRMLRTFISDHDFEAFPAVTVSQTLSGGVNALVQCAGIGAFRPNLIFLGWSADPDRRRDIDASIRAVARLGRSLAILRGEPFADDPWIPPPGPIDIWWRGQANGPLMLLLAHLTRKNDGWIGRPIRLIRMIEKEAGRAGSLAHLAELGESARIAVTPIVVVGTQFRPLLLEQSRDSALVILGFDLPEVSDEGAFLDRLDALTHGIPRVLFVRSAGDMSLDD